MFLKDQKVGSINIKKEINAMIYGYARVNTNEQELDAQATTLKEAGAAKVYKEITSGAHAEKKEFNQLLEELRSGDMLLVTKPESIAKSLSHLEQVVTELTAKGMTVNILNLGLFTAASMENPMTKLLFHVLETFVEFERSMAIERTQEGRKNAREKGVKFGRKSKKYKIEGPLLEAIQQVEEGKLSQPEGAELAGCSVATFKRRLKEYREQIENNSFR